MSGECTVRHHSIDEVVRCAHLGDDYVAVGKSDWFETIQPGWYLITSAIGNGGSFTHSVQKTEVDSEFAREHERLFGILP